MKDQVDSMQEASLSEAKRKLLENYVRGDLVQASVRSNVISRRPPGEPAPLSPAQEHVWRRAQSTVGLAPFYNESITIHRTGPLDVSILERSFCEVIRRHEIWRTTYDTVDGKPVQIIHPAPKAIEIPVVDLRRLPTRGRESKSLRLGSEDASRPFDLKQGPLVRAMLARLDEEEYRLYLTMHQSVVDGVTVYNVFPRELTTIYSAFVAGHPSPLAELPVQYADFAYWQRQRMQGETRAEQVAYWRRQLAGAIPALPWPTDHPRPPAETYRGLIRPFTYSKNWTEGLKNLSQREGVTLFMTLLAGFTALLHRYTGQKDILVGTVSPAGRKHTEVQNLIGYFLNLVALRSDLSMNPSFRELLQQAKEATIGALSNDDVPLEDLAEELGLKPDPSRHPFFQVAISLSPNLTELAPGWNQTFMDVESGGARWDLYLELNERLAGSIGRAQYNPDLFEPQTISSMLKDLEVLLGTAAIHPEFRISDLHLASG